MTGHRPVDTRAFGFLLAATFCSLANYAPLLSVVPMWAAAGGAGGAGLGATTAVMMGATVAAQLAMPWLMRRVGLRTALAAGAGVMAVGTPAYLLSDALGPVLVVSAVRGVGFALVVVAGAALVSELVAPTHLSRATGLFGLAAGLPNVVVLPLGVLVAERVGFTWVFLGCALLAAAAVPAALALRGRDRTAGRTGAWARTSPTHHGVPVGPLVPPALAFLVVAAGLGGATTFLPSAAGAEVASTALLALSVGMIVGRVGAGPLGEGRPGRLMLPAAVAAAVGTGATAAGVGPAPVALVVLGAAVFGLGFGAMQNDSLVVILGRAGPGGHGTASTVWNIGFDAGTGVGAAALGLVVAGADHVAAFGVAAGAMALVALGLLSRRRASAGPRPPAPRGPGGGGRRRGT